MTNNYKAEMLAAGNSAEWDRFVLSHPRGTIFHRHEWLAATAHPISYLVCRDKTNEIVAGLPLIERPIAWYKRYSSPLYTPYVGVLVKSSHTNKTFTNNTENKLRLVTLLQALPTADWLYFALDYDITDTQPFHWFGFKTNIIYTYRLTQGQSLEAIWDQMEPNRRNRIRKAIRDGITVSTTEDIEVLLNFDKMVFSRQGLPYNNSNYIRRLWGAIQSMGQGAIYVAKDANGQPVAAHMNVWDSHTTYNLIGGRDHSRQDVGADPLVIWYGIQECVKRGHTFDFEGSTIPRVERFVRSWGGQLHAIITMERITSKPLFMLKAWSDMRAAGTMRQSFAKFSCS